MDVQTARPNPDDTWARFDTGDLVALLIEIRQRSPQRLQNVFDSQPLMFPFIHRGVFQVEHDPRRTRVQHLYNQLRVVRRTGHLIPLILTPCGQLDFPTIADRRTGEAVSRFVVLLRFRQHPAALFHQARLPGREALMQRCQESQERFGQVTCRVEARGRAV